MLTLGFDTGPAWSLTTFKGPSGGKGIFNGGRVTTDNLIVAFAVPAKQAPAPKPPTADQVRQNLFPDKTVLTPKEKAQLENVIRLFNALHPPPPPVTSAPDLQNFTNSIILQNLSGQLHQ